ncbi:sporulation-specific diadenylate cyclase CdaS [Peribacillus sp. NPDC060186]
MYQKDCDFSPLKEQLTKGLEDISIDINTGINTLKNDNFCLLGKLEDIKNKFEKVETIAASFYLNCYLSPYTDKYLDISTCIQHLSNQRHGALIVIERNDGLDSLIRAGTHIGATLTHSLLESIFYPGNPLHDGAVLVRTNQIFSAANILPLSSKGSGEKKLGTRHRSALGLAEKSDALVLVVSEETGRVSFAVDGRIYPIISTSSFFKKGSNGIG